MLQVIALATTCFTCFVFQKLTETFIRVVLAVLSQALLLPIADQSLADQARKHRFREKLFYPEPRRVFQADHSAEVCRQGWPRLRQPESGDCTPRQRRK